MEATKFTEYEESNLLPLTTIGSQVTLANRTIAVIIRN